MGKGRSTVHVLPLSLHAGAHRACYLSHICGRPTPYRGSPAQRWHLRHCKSPVRWYVHAYPSPAVCYRALFADAQLRKRLFCRWCRTVARLLVPRFPQVEFLTCCLLLFRTVSVSPSLTPSTVARNMADNMLWLARLPRNVRKSLAEVQSPATKWKYSLPGQTGISPLIAHGYTRERYYWPRGFGAGFCSTGKL